MLFRSTTPVTTYVSPDEIIPTTTNTVTVNGKSYGVTEVDVQNPDGTFSVKNGDTVISLGGKLTVFVQPSFEVCPSRIPYSAITEDNINEAFPLLGDWVGYIPAYRDNWKGLYSTQELVIANLRGLNQGEVMNGPRYEFASEQAYLDWQEQCRLIREESARADEKIENGTLGDATDADALDWSRFLD